MSRKFDNALVLTIIGTCGPLAQLAEQLTLNQRVGGSSPSRLTCKADSYRHGNSLVDCNPPSCLCLAQEVIVLDGAAKRVLLEQLTVYAPELNPGEGI